MSGALIGKKQNGVSFSANTVHGVRFRNLTVGAGISYDHYGSWRTIPVFGMIAYDFPSLHNNRLYIQLSSGATAVKHVDSENDNFVFHEKGGRMIQPSVGYKIKSDRWSLYITGGYRFQRIKYVQTYRDFWGFREGDQPKTTVTRDMNRLFIQVGFGIN